MNCCGKTCVKCAERVVVECEGRGCRRCGVVWHRGCVDAENICPSCGMNATLLAQAETDNQRAVSRDRKLRGMSWYIAIILLRTLNDVPAIGIVLGSGRKVSLWGILLPWILFFIVWLTAFLGHSGMRLLLGIVHITGTLVWFFLLPSITGMAMYGMAACAFVAWACLFSRDLKYYEESRR